MNIRPATENDIARIVQLFTESVHGIASGSYNQEQLDAWAPRPPDVGQWRPRLRGCATLVAWIRSELAGFISFTPKGHIEFLYTTPEYSRRGIATRLFISARDRLHEQGIDRFTTAASLEARPFFARQGFKVVKEETVLRNGVTFKRYSMASDGKH